MSLSDEDKKEFKKLIVMGVGEALDEVVLPEFEKINKKFEQIDQRFEQMDKKFDSIDGQFQEVRNDIARLERKLDEKRLRLVEAAVA